MEKGGWEGIFIIFLCDAFISKSKYGCSSISKPALSRRAKASGKALGESRQGRMVSRLIVGIAVSSICNAHLIQPRQAHAPGLAEILEILPLPPRHFTWHRFDKVKTLIHPSSVSDYIMFFFLYCSINHIQSSELPTEISVVIAQTASNYYYNHHQKFYNNKRFSKQLAELWVGMISGNTCQLNYFPNSPDL